IDLGKENRHNRRLKPFSLPASVQVSNTISEKFTVIEVSGLDRQGLLHQLTRAISDLSLTIASAHIGTYGEKAVDVFYVTDLMGQKIQSRQRQRRIRDALLEVFESQPLNRAEEARAVAAGGERRAGEVTFQLWRGPLTRLAYAIPPLSQGRSGEEAMPRPISPLPRGKGRRAASDEGAFRQNLRSRSGSPPPMTLYRNFLNVGAMTTGSRILGFVRDALVAAVLGTGFAADAYLAAFRFPNLFRRLFAKELEQEGMEPARLWAGRIISWLTVVVWTVTLLVEIFMPWILPLFVPGFVDDKAKFDLTVLLTRICFPYLMCMSLMAAYSAVLNGLNRFTASSFAPILLNIVMIAFMLPLVLYHNTDVQTAVWIAIGTIAGGIAQLAMVYAAIRRAKFVPNFRWPKFDADVRRFWVLAVPAVLTGGITQINIFVGTIIASGAPSAIAYLYYADRLYQLPLGIIGIAIGTVLLPELARHLKGGRDKEADAAQNQSLLISMLLSMPAATALIALAFPIVRVLFQHGAFDATATAETANTLIWFSAGLPAYVLIRVLQPGFFAREDTLT